MLKLCLTVILLGCVTQINCENLPVFIWGQKTLSSFPALSQLNGDEFVTLVKSQSTKETLTVVFVENKLSVEDFSQCRLKTKTCFTNLRKIQQKTYLTAVDDPVEALKESYGEQSQKSISISTDDDLNELVDAVDSEKLLFVYLDNVESNDDFANHDELMSQFYNVLASKRENVIAIYTARHPSFVYSVPLIRKTRQVPPTENPKKAQHFINAENRLLLAFDTFKIRGKAQDVDQVKVSFNQTTEEEMKSIQNVVIESEGTRINMFIVLSGGTWYVERFTIFEDGNVRKYRPEYPISAYKDKSFGCYNITATDANNNFTFENIQMQPEFGIATNLTRFSNSHNDCVGFFSAAIWGALFVIIILAMIMSCGLTAIMDIKTMDRFDDPKGKTITINAQE